MEKVTKKELLRRIEVLEEWSGGADEMLDELNHALPDPEYDAQCEQNAVAVQESLARHAVRLGLVKPKLKQLDQSVFDGLPSEYKWVARDRNGSRYAYAEKPRPREVDGVWVHTGGKHARYVDNSYDDAGWQNSLIERKELTGNELCLKLLNLDLDVMCDVKDGDYRLIFAHDGEFFISHNKGERECHKNVTPINNQGERLTAADVGL